MKASYRWGGSFALVTAVHVALGVGLLRAGSAPEPLVGEGAPVVVELAEFVGAPPSDVPAQASVPSEPEREPEPQPQPEPELAEVPPETEPKPSESLAERMSAQEPEPEPEPRESTADRTNSPEHHPPQPANDLQAPIQGLEQAVHVASLRSTWQGRVNAHLERHKRYPHAARSRREQGEARLRFSMDRRGRVVQADLDQSSGYFLLDREVQAVVRRAQPLPEPPDDVPGEVLELVWRVQFEIR